LPQRDREQNGKLDSNIGIGKSRWQPEVYRETIEAFVIQTR
jgi:hypothetical protein